MVKVSNTGNSKGSKREKFKGLLNSVVVELNFETSNYGNFEAVRSSIFKISNQYKINRCTEVTEFRCDGVMSDDKV